SWCTSGLPQNVRLLGHVDEEQKVRLLSEAWVAINTSVHEALAVSLVEALSCETPLLSCVNPGFMVSRYGVYAGQFDGSGMDAIDSLRRGLQTLLENPVLRLDLGRRGRAWARSTHCPESFLAAFFRLC